MSRDILIDLIDADPDQPRRHFDADQLAELAESIAANGLIVPILLRPVGERFVIVHGERRFRACQSLGWSTIPAEVRDLDVETARWLALVENIQRADLSPIEEAQAYAAALATGLTQLQLGKRIGKTQLGKTSTFRRLVAGGSRRLVAGHRGLLGRTGRGRRRVAHRRHRARRRAIRIAAILEFAL